jgi:hypothetical protein
MKVNSSRSGEPTLPAMTSIIPSLVADSVVHHPVGTIAERDDRTLAYSFAVAAVSPFSQAAGSEQQNLWASHPVDKLM